jgi:dTDP-4-amino-4,6-dideoxygalactose transaminase
MGEGGGIVIPDVDLRSKAEILREKGTDRSRFWRGEVDKYTWRAAGSSYLPSDVLAAMLCAQLTRFDEIMQSRLRVWNAYHQAFVGAKLEDKGWRLPIVPDNCTHNAHMYYLIAPGADERTRMLGSLVNEYGVYAVSHYEPLHASPMGSELGYKPNDLPLTLDYAARIVRLPMYAGMNDDDLTTVIDSVLKACSA